MRAGMVAASVRHVTVHLGTLGLSVGQAHGFGDQVQARPLPHDRGLRCARRRSDSRGRGRARVAGAAPTAPPHPSPPTTTPATTAAAAAAVTGSSTVGAAPAGPRRGRGWLRSAAFHQWRRAAMRRAFRCFANQSLANMLPSQPMDMSAECAGRGCLKRPISALVSTDSCSLLSKQMNPHAPAWVPSYER